jgi:hypothetical protein
MLELIRLRLTFANIVAMTALCVAVGGGIAVGAGSFSNSTITACVGKQRQLLLANANGKCKKGQKKVAWNQQGIQGNPGTAGSQGPAGDAATNLTAYVNSDGTLLGGKGVVSAAKLPFIFPAGSYDVQFDRNVDTCVYSVTMTKTDGVAVLTPGEVAARPRGPSQLSDVMVGTFDSAGTSQDRPFHLAVFC